MTMTGEAAVHPRLAATVMLLRENAGGVETLLVRRHTAIAFMGGIWVFPGGKLEAADAARDALSRIPPDALSRAEQWSTMPGRPCSAQEALGLYVAGCRETFEEAGVLLARHADGSPCSPAEVERLQGERGEIARRPAAFVEMLRREGLLLDGALVPWAHWVTPSLERIRFDARFFAAAVPPDQAVVLDATESIDHAWITPAAALAAFQRGEIVLAGPTVVTLSEALSSMAAHGSLSAMLSAEKTRAIAPIIPKLRREGSVVMAYLPWDPEYPAIEGEGTPPGVEVPERLRQFPSRMPLPSIENRIVR